ncbi:GH25 family lysozyme [Dactylosporangium sp. NPDC000521]|uniref:GH25 family lysozyme n=1 Tax=Dactylosporangium sp. NPDC000521 TaxID=3363975 RepID=UPI0036C65A5D
MRHAGFTRDAQTLVPFVDLEWPYAGIRIDDCYNLNPQQTRAWIRAFIDRIQARIGRKPMIYTNTYWWNPCTGGSASTRDTSTWRLIRTTARSRCAQAGGITSNEWYTYTSDEPFIEVCP